MQLLSCSHKEYNLVVGEVPLEESYVPLNEWTKREGRKLKVGKLKLVTFKKILVLMENKKHVQSNIQLQVSVEIECGVTVLNLWSKDTQTWFFHG